MAVTEYRDITKINWIGRLGASAKGMFVGLALFIAGFPLLFWNEGRAVKTARSLDEGAGAVVEAGAEAVDPANEGKLVHVAGMTAVAGELSDPEFGISAAAMRLRRQVEIFQWVEESSSETVTVDGVEKEKVTYTYTRKWCFDTVDSSGFKEEGHENGLHEKRFADLDILAEGATLGAFALSAKEIRAMGGGAPFAYPAGYAAPESLGGAQFAANAVYVPAVPQAAAPVPAAAADGTNAPAPAAVRQIAASPEIGDMRVTFSVVMPHEISVVKAQKGNGFEAWKASNGREIALQRDGIATAEAMFESARESNKFVTMLLRIVGFLVMFIGLRKVLGPLAVLVDVIPVVREIVSVGVSLIAGLVAAVCALVTIALAWITYRPLVAIPLLVAAAALVAFLVSRRKRA